MALHIKSDRTVTEVKPVGREFSLDEMHTYVGGWLEAIPLTQDLVMYVNEEGILLGLPLNVRAIEKVKVYRPGYSYPIVGDVLIASLVETGDTEDKEVEAGIASGQAFKADTVVVDSNIVSSIILVDEGYSEGDL